MSSFSRPLRLSADSESAMNVSEPMNPRQLGIIGAGVIGVGVVQDLAQTGHDVTVVDTDSNALRNAEKVIRRNVRLHHLMAALAKPLNVDEVMMRIQFATDAAELSDCQFVIENITEDWQAKKDLYENIDRICNSSCIFAVNTSVIPITRIASLTSRPDKVIGMHFMNPVPLKPVVEVRPVSFPIECSC
ncbi:MAG: 3-hydroxyacyl-CoA dehydrogenase family protein [Litorivicinaceae bacterium]